MRVQSQVHLAVFFVFIVAALFFLDGLAAIFCGLFALSALDTHIALDAGIKLNRLLNEVFIKNINNQ